MDCEWVISIQKQCHRARVPFFFKQWGGVQKSKTGRQIDGQTFDGFPKTKTKDQPPSKQTRHKLMQRLDHNYAGVLA
jgi:hypothetical protein